MTQTKTHYEIVALTKVPLEKVKTFTDMAIGSGYFSISELTDILKRSQKNGHCCSFILRDAQTTDIKGIRLSFPPGNWSHGKGGKLSPQLWKTPLEETAYFQSLFLAPETQGTGWGVKLSLRAIEELKQLGAKAIVCHSWVESPHDSSRKYLTKLGFQAVKQYPHYWKDVDYQCTRCGKPCLCTAEEMILYL